MAHNKMDKISANMSPTKCFWLNFVSGSSRIAGSSGEKIFLQTPRVGRIAFSVPQP
jgi:hypothetical protein